MKQPSHLEGAKKINLPLSPYDDAVLLWEKRDDELKEFVTDRLLKFPWQNRLKTLYFDREANWWSNAIRTLL
jgi:hypothetical protein